MDLLVTDVMLSKFLHLLRLRGDFRLKLVVCWIIAVAAHSVVKSTVFTCFSGSSRRREHLKLLIWTLPSLSLRRRGRLPILKSDDWLLLLINRVYRLLLAAAVVRVCSVTDKSISDCWAIFGSSFALEYDLGDFIDEAARCGTLRLVILHHTLLLGRTARPALFTLIGEVSPELGRILLLVGGALVIAAARGALSRIMLAHQVSI